MEDSKVKFIAANVRKLREEYGISRNAMAMKLAYSLDSYAGIERGSRCLSCQTLISLCKFYNCRPERIINGEDPAQKWEIPNYFAGYSERERRRIYRLLYIALDCHLNVSNVSFHKLFGSDILSKIPPEEENILPYILEYERKNMNLPKKRMADYVGISKNKYYGLLKGAPLLKIDMFLTIQKKLEYDMGFLLFNRVYPEFFLAEISHSWNQREQALFEQQLDIYSAMERVSRLFHAAQGKDRK